MIELVLFVVTFIIGNLIARKYEHNKFIKDINEYYEIEKQREKRLKEIKEKCYEQV